MVNLILHEGHEMAYLKSFLITGLSGACIWFICHKDRKEIQIHDGFLMVILFWSLICLYATLPFVFLLDSKIGFIDIAFECISGLTTTGVSIFAFPEELPASLLFYRQQLQFLGGISIIVLTVAIMPILGVGGTRLYRTETPGALKDTKFTPRITQTAKALWSVYLLLTFLCFCFFKCMGASWLEAIEESFTTISTGGLMTHHNGFSYYENPWVEWGAPIFMLLGSINFGRHYLFIKKRNFSVYWSEEELRFYLYTILFSLGLASIIGILHNPYFDLIDLRHLYFNLISLVSSTGAIYSDYSQLPLSIIFIFIILALCGGCHGSTTGGLKMIRVLILSKFYQRELKVLLHPQLISHIKYNQKSLDNPILFSLLTFVMTFLALYALLIFLMLLADNDLISAISMVTATLSNSGIALGKTAQSYSDINTFSKLVSIFAMIAGRLEIFSLLIVFSLAYWKD
jgi:trk system potassium uptake protein TrkH